MHGVGCMKLTWYYYAGSYRVSQGGWLDGMQGGIRDKRGLQLPTRRGRRALSGFFDKMNGFDELKWSWIVVLLLCCQGRQRE